MIFYADIQNIYNYKALGPDELVPVENPDGSYRKDPDREGYYQMRSIKMSGRNGFTLCRGNCGFLIHLPDRFSVSG